MVSGQSLFETERPVGSRILRFYQPSIQKYDGQIIGVVVVAHEVTEQVLANMHLQTALNQSRLSKEAADWGRLIWVCKKAQ
jgi:hypothetical protein